jgi:hypothetical protein
MDTTTTATTTATITTAALSIAQFWDRIKNTDKTNYKRIIQHLMSEYGTALHCNRFPVGNCNEYAIADVIRQTHMTVIEMQDAKRDDMEVKEFGRFSIKFTTASSVKLHNSLGENKDVKMHNTLLVTPTEWWFLAPAEIAAVGVTLSDYLKNTTDGLELKMSLLTALKAKQYPYFFKVDLQINKAACKHKELARVAYDAVKAALGIP